MRIGREDYDNGSGGGGGEREQVKPDDTYEAVVGAIDYVGVQPGYNGKPPRDTVCIAFELSERDSKGRRFVMFGKYGMALWKKADGSGDCAPLRAVLDALRPGSDNSEVDTADFVGLNCRVLIGRDKKGKSKLEKVLPAKAGQAMKAEQDYTKPFGLTSWLLKNRIDKE